MIREVTMYQAVCDGCVRKFSRVYPDKHTAEFTPTHNAAWKEIDGHLYCPGCVEYDPKTDSYKPKEEKQ